LIYFILLYQSNDIFYKTHHSYPHTDANPQVWEVKTALHCSYNIFSLHHHTYKKKYFLGFLIEKINGTSPLKHRTNKLSRLAAESPCRLLTLGNFRILWTLKYFGGFWNLRTIFN